MPSPPLRCPSCDHDNPAEANFCNQCGMPVDFRVCEACEAVNRGHSSRCHKCGELMFTPSADPQPSQTTTQEIDATTPPQAIDATTPSTAAVVAYEGEPRLTRLPDLAELEPDESQKRNDSRLFARHRRVRWVAIAIVAFAALAVPAYVAYEDPTHFRQAINRLTDLSNAKLPESVSGTAPAPDAPKPELPTSAAEPSGVTAPER